MNWQDRAAPVLITVFPLVVVPGIDRPFSTPKTLLLGGIVCAGAVAAAATGRLKRPRMPAAFTLSFCAYLLTIVVSALIGDFCSQQALRLSLLGAGWFLLLVSVQPRADYIVRAVALSCSLVAALALLQYAGFDPFTAMGLSGPVGGGPRMRVFSTIGNPDFTAAVLVAGIFPSICLAENSSCRTIFWVATILEGLAVFATGSRAAIPGILAGSIWLGAAKWRPNRAWLGAGTLVILGLLVLAPSRTLISTVDGRLYILKVSAPHLFERSSFGYGPGGFEPKYIQWETDYWTSGIGSAADRRFAQLQEHAHNEYIETVVDNGLAGFFTFLSLLVSFFLFAFRGSRKGLVAAASAGVAALCAVALVDFPFHRPTELFLFWTLSATVFLQGG